MRRRTIVGVLVVLSLVTAGGALGPAAGGQADLPGTWSDAFSENGEFDAAAPANVGESLKYPPAVSMVVLPDGRVLYWGGLEGLENSAAPLAADAGRSAELSRARILDVRDPTPAWDTFDGVEGQPGTPGSQETGTGDDMFCADQRVLYDGSVIIAGGTRYESDPLDLTPFTGEAGPGGTAELFGSENTRLFDPATDEFELIGDMNHGRWYPTLVTLPDGDQFVASGVGRLIYNTAGTNVQAVERLDLQAEQPAWDEIDGADTSLPLFSRLHLLPDGTVFYGGDGQMWSPFGQSPDQALWNLHKAYDPATESWTVTGVGAYGARSGAFSVLLPLRPSDGYEASILVGGGTLGTSPGSYLATDLSEIITVADGESSSVEGPRLNNARWYSSGVPLPNGDVVVVSGATADEVIAPGSEQAVRQAELYDASENAFVGLDLAGRDRTYHNSAVLLADGTVLVGGHSPINAGYGPTGDNTYKDGLRNANNMKDPSFEILTPPYLEGNPDRPVIAEVQRGIAWDGAFSIETEDAGGIDRVMLVRLPTTTHTTDADMRVVELAFSAEGDELTAIGPPDGKVAPPGFYYLFALDGDTPSKAFVVSVGADEDENDAVAPMGNE